jgi:dTDP-4-dehydrorhamnose 3,5-epimerase
MRVEKTRLDGVLLITPPTIFSDHRGTFVETYNEAAYREAGIDQYFVQDDISVSGKNVLRGLHGDRITYKLVSCLAGEIFLAVVNYDMKSHQFKHWQGFKLSEDNRCQILIPPKFANGHFVVSDGAIFQYKQTAYYDREGQFSLRWNDPILGVEWPTESPILSERDGSSPMLSK